MRLLIAFLCLSIACSAASAALPPEVRKELSELSKELKSVTALVRKKQIEDAQAVIQKVEDRVKELNIAEDERDRSLLVFHSTLERAKASIPVSFEKDVAPIIKEKCLGCHGETRASANLRMDTYANMGQVGQNGPLLIPRNPNRSKIIARLTTTDAQARMPKNGQPLSPDEIGVIGRWIAGGAAFDGEDVTAPIGASMAEKTPEKPPVKVVMADGSESVSFKNDIAPWLVNVCSGCHTGNRIRGGYNMSTFEQLLAGGDTGSTIVPGDPDSSYIVDLVLRQEPIKMPAGNQTAIKRSQALALETWIKEGAHFDGIDPKATLRSLVPTDAELAAAAMASMSDEEFSRRRLDQAAEIWKRVAPREEAGSSTTENLYVYGNVPQSRLDEIAAWGKEQVDSLTTKYKLPDGEKPWRGRLIVFVAKNRFDYEEFNTVLMNRRTPRGVSGHTVITANFADAYVTLHDVGDTESADSLNARLLLNSLLATAYLSRSGANLPDWLRQGFGMMEAAAGQDSPYFKLIPQRASQALATIASPATVFDDGTFSPEDVGPVGLLLTRFLVTQGGIAKLQQLTGALQTSRNVGQAIQATFGVSAADLGTAFLQSGGR
ncbi:MAG: c-type cytochrome domain-containing protein [Planctomycetaceae bacterium]